MTTIPTIPTEFDIYSSMEGSDEVNAAIATAVAAMRDEIVAAHKDTDIGSKFLNRLVKTHINPVFSQYVKYGTRDGEPGSAVAHYLKRLLKALGAVDDFNWYGIRDDLML